MGPRPSMGVPAPRAMPPYKYATSIRNTNPQVVQPIALQQVNLTNLQLPPSSLVSSRPSNVYFPFHYFSVPSLPCFKPFVACLPPLRLSQLYMCRVRSLSHPPCWLLHPLRSRSRCWVSAGTDWWCVILVLGSSMPNCRV